MHTMIKVSLALLICSLTEAQAQPKDFTIGTTDSIYSATLKEPRRLWISLPKGYHDSTRARKSYPVLYLLDPEPHFHYTTGLIAELGGIQNGNLAIPEMIVVGIMNTDRGRDMTPTHMFVDKFTGDSNRVRTSGGAEKFVGFLRNELLPYIDKKYATLPNRTIIGHSLTGLLVVHTLLNHPDLFDNYIALDPSLWWDDEKLVQGANDLLKDKGKYKNKSLYIAIANTFFKGGTLEKARTDTSRVSTSVKPMLLLSDKIAANKNNGLQFRYQYYPNDNHTLVPIQGIHDGLRFVFDYFDYRMPVEDQFDFTLASIQRYEQHFQNVSNRFGFAFPPPEVFTDMLSGLAFMLKRLPEEEYLLKMNVKHYPNSHRAHARLGDFYQDTGSKDKAIACYTQAQQIRDIKSTKNKLEKLQMIKP